ncbi:MAG: MmgE/PrpD family protein, partial [Betaproteobacteria bacterium]
MADLPESPTLALARWVTQSRWQDVPEAARLAARRSWLNWWGCALGGAADPEVDRLVAALLSLGAGGAAPLLGRSERLDLPSAALVHAFASNILDYDDTHWATAIHPAGPVASALLAWSSQHPCAGADVLHAFVLGMEVECAVGMAVSPAHYAKGWHISATCGVFGAAAAVGRLMRLSQAEMAWALGHAATQASGLVASLGSSAKSLNIAHAARN